MADLQLPSLLSNSPANLVGPASSTGTGANTPLLPLGLGAGGSTNIANAAMARMATSSSSISRLPNLTIPTAGMQPSPLSITSAASTHTHRARESSLGASTTDANSAKRRRLQGPLGNITLPASNLRQSSLGPGTPRQNTPTSRAGSAGPQRSKKSSVKNIAAQHSQSQTNMRKKVGAKGVVSSKKSSASTARRLAGAGASAATSDNNASGSDSDSASVSSLVAADGGVPSTSTATPGVPGHDGALDSDDNEQNEAGYEDEGDDNKLYCICHSVSHGNMVACDNENCPYEWFHWECVGMTQEPKGRWLCTECRKLPPGLVKLAR